MNVWVELLGSWVYPLGAPVGFGLCYERTNVRTNERITYEGSKSHVTERAREEARMNANDADRITELASSVWPVKNDEPTRQVWALALARTNFYDAQDAVGQLASERKTIHVSDVVKRAERIRADLVRSLPVLPDPPVELADDPAASILWTQTVRERKLNQLRMERCKVPA